MRLDTFFLPTGTPALETTEGNFPHFERFPPTSVASLGHPRMTQIESNKLAGILTVPYFI